MHCRIGLCGLVLALVPGAIGADEPATAVGLRSEMRLSDNSKIVLSLLDEQVAIQTPYGKLRVPMAEVRRIDFSYRMSEEAAKQIESLVAELASHDTRPRDIACDRLLKLGPKAHPAVARASKDPNRSLAISARQLLAKFQEAFPDERLPQHDFDVIHTSDARIAGRIETPVFRVLTPQFGEKVLRLPDMISLRALGAAPVAGVIAYEPGPQNLLEFQGQVGKVRHFKVTGANNGSIYGTDVYTLDSNLATAAVHAGILKASETGIVKVTIAEGQQSYLGSTRQGVTSNGWGTYGGSYKLAKPEK